MNALQNVASVYVSDILTIDDNLDMISSFGEIFNVKTVAEKLEKDIQLKLDNFNLFMKEKSVNKVAYFIWSNPWMVAGGSNFINELMKLNKFENVFKIQERYPEIDLNALAKLNPELILLSSEPYPFKEKHKQHLEKFTDANIKLVDGEFFSWYGSRLLKAFDYFKTLH